MTRTKSSSLRKSFKMSKLSKKKSYGYYCDLCRKYNYDILAKSAFKPIMINDVERRHLAEQYTNEIDFDN